MVLRKVLRPEMWPVNCTVPVDSGPPCSPQTRSQDLCNATQTDREAHPDVEAAVHGEAAELGAALAGAAALAALHGEVAVAVDRVRAEAGCRGGLGLADGEADIRGLGVGAGVAPGAWRAFQPANLDAVHVEPAQALSALNVVSTDPRSTGHT